jgi:hypothetical protein
MESGELGSPEVKRHELLGICLPDGLRMHDPHDVPQAKPPYGPAKLGGPDLTSRHRQRRSRFRSEETRAPSLGQ